MLLSKDQVERIRRQSADTAYADVPCEPWGCTVRLRRLTARDVMAITKRHAQDPEAEGEVVIDDDQQVDFMSAILSRSIVDEQNELLFGDESGLEFLKQEPANVVIELANAAFKLSGMTVKKVDVLEKNSPTTPNASSPSDSA